MRKTQKTRQLRGGRLWLGHLPLYDNLTNHGEQIVTVTMVQRAASLDPPRNASPRSRWADDRMRRPDGTEGDLLPRRDSAMPADD